MVQNKENDSESKERASFLWRFKDLPDDDKDRINQWIDHQQNVKLSINEVIMYIIDRFGYADIMSHAIKKQLHQEEVFRDLHSVLSTTTISSTPLVTVPSELPVKTGAPSPPFSETDHADDVTNQSKDTGDDQQDTPESENSDIFSNMDPDGF